jgi:hypothetical protein
MALASLGVGQGVGLASPDVGQRSAVTDVGQRTGVPCGACQVLSLTPDQVGLAPATLPETRVAVRVRPGDEGWAAALGVLRQRGARAALHIVGIPPENDPILGAEADALILEPGEGDPDRVAFELKRALAAARGARPAARLFVAAAGALAAALGERGVGPYATGFILPGTPIGAASDLTAPRPAAAFALRVLPQGSAEAAGILAAAIVLHQWIPDGLVAVPDRPASCGEDRRIPTFLNPGTLDLVAITRSCPAPAVVTSDMPGAFVERLDLQSLAVFIVRAGQGDRFAAGVDVAAARTLTVEEIVARHQAAAARQEAAIATIISEGSMVLTFEAPGFVAPVTITSRTTIFRGPASDVRGPTADGRSAATEVQQAQIRVNGVSFDARGGVPRLPIIEPERAAAPPLTITLSDVYAYRLAGRESVRGRDAFVIAFAPRSGGAALYKGRAWIDVTTFNIIRVAAAQTGLKGAITASEQTDDFEPDSAGHWLLARSDVRQTYEGASVRTPIHRLTIIERHVVNAADFEQRRAAAHASPDVMLRDTADGYRYLTKPGAGSRKQEAGSGKPPASARPESHAGYGVRVVAGRAERIRTFAIGVIVDPNISQPLPFAGLSYVDFNLFGTGTQFSGFFGGSYGQLAFSAPSLAGTRWQLGGRAFAIASSYNDRAFEGGLEQYTLDIRQRPAQAAVWLLRPLSARTTMRLEYGWDFNDYDRGDVTAPAFVIPRNQNAHTIRVGLDAQRAGWQGSIWGSYARRIGWRRWGLPGPSSEFREAHRDYQRYGASLLRSRAVSSRVTTRIEAAVMGGSDLDRFSRYAFGTFDNRLHGYPSALIRYDRGGVIRTAAAVSAFRALRLDGFADVALVRDPGFGRNLRQYTGLGTAVEAPAPFGMLLSLEWGYGVQGVDTDGRRGTHVVRLSGYKVF